MPAQETFAEEAHTRVPKTHTLKDWITRPECKMLILPTIPHTFLQGSGKNHHLCNTHGKPELPRDTRCLPRNGGGKLSAESRSSCGMTDMSYSSSHSVQLSVLSCHPQGDSIAGQTKGEMIKGFCTRITFWISKSIFPLENNCKFKCQNKTDYGVETLSRALLLNVSRRQNWRLRFLIPRDQIQ